MPLTVTIASLTRSPPVDPEDRAPFETNLGLIRSVHPHIGPTTPFPLRLWWDYELDYVRRLWSFRTASPVAEARRLGVLALATELDALFRWNGDDARRPSEAAEALAAAQAWATYPSEGAAAEAWRRAVRCQNAAYHGHMAAGLLALVASGECPLGDLVSVERHIAAYARAWSLDRKRPDLDLLLFRADR